MIIYYAGSGSGDFVPEKVLDKPSVLLTYYDFWKRNDKLTDRFETHKERRSKKREKRSKRKS